MHNILCLIRQPQNHVVILRAVKFRAVQFLSLQELPIEAGKVTDVVVRKATQGLANYINKNGDPKKGVAISYDSRRMSPEFAKETALCLAANGIKAYLSDTLRPVPEESFALRYFGCQAGVEITASHNPPEYNGYKVYWEDGAQVTPPHDTGIIADVNAVSSYDEVKTMPEKEAVEKGLLV